MNPPVINSKYGIPCVIQVFGLVQNSAVSALCIFRENFFLPSDVDSIEKPYFGFLLL